MGLRTRARNSAREAPTPSLRPLLTGLLRIFGKRMTCLPAGDPLEPSVAIATAAICHPQDHSCNGVLGFEEGSALVTLQSGNWKRLELDA
jgi:hypothetical protein